MLSCISLRDLKVSGGTHGDANLHSSDRILGPVELRLVLSCRSLRDLKVSGGTLGDANLHSSDLHSSDTI